MVKTFFGDSRWMAGLLICDTNTLNALEEGKPTTKLFQLPFYAGMHRR